MVGFVLSAFLTTTFSATASRLGPLPQGSSALGGADPRLPFVRPQLPRSWARQPVPPGGDGTRASGKGHPAAGCAPGLPPRGLGGRALSSVAVACERLAGPWAASRTSRSTEAPPTKPQTWLARPRVLPSLTQIGTHTPPSGGPALPTPQGWTRLSHAKRSQIKQNKPHTRLTLTQHAPVP